MANYIIFLEGINREFFIDADSRDEALEKAREKYRLSKVVDAVEDRKDKIILKKLKCLRCGYEWYPKPPKHDILPKTCPNKKCKSPYWNKPRKNEESD